MDRMAGTARVCGVHLLLVSGEDQAGPSSRDLELTSWCRLQKTHSTFELASESYTTSRTEPGHSVVSRP